MTAGNRHKETQPIILVSYRTSLQIQAAELTFLHEVAMPIVLFHTFYLSAFNIYYGNKNLNAFIPPFPSCPDVLFPAYCCSSSWKIPKVLFWQKLSLVKFEEVKTEIKWSCKSRCSPFNWLYICKMVPVISSQVLLNVISLVRKALCVSSLFLSQIRSQDLSKPDEIMCSILASCIYGQLFWVTSKAHGHL